MATPWALTPQKALANFLNRLYQHPHFADPKATESMSSKLPRKQNSTTFSPSPTKLRQPAPQALGTTCSCGRSTLKTFPPNKCTGCKTKIYCCRSCQASDWPFHKHSCKQTASQRNITASPSLVNKPAIRKDTQTNGINPRIMNERIHWLADLPKSTCYHIIIDTYRLRLEAEWGNVEKFCHGDYEMLLTHFHEFLEGLIAVKGMPEWWEDRNMTACAEVAIDTEANACILHSVENLTADVAKKYGNENVPRQLLGVAERVYGWCANY